MSVQERRWWEHRSILRVALILTLVCAGCATTAQLKLPSRPGRDATTSAGSGTHFRKLMVLPPTGSERGSASSDELVELERFLLGKGVRIVSSGVTGRVVQDNGLGGVAAADLSDLERALILARRSEADGLLQVIEMRWVKGSRLYVLENGVFTRNDDAERYDRRVKVLLEEFIFRARLIEVEHGEVVYSLDVRQDTANVDRIDQAFLFKANNRDGLVEYDTATPARQERVLDQVAERIARHLAP